MIAVIIPCYKVRRHILSVVNAISLDVSLIYVVDDKCPESTGKHVQQHCLDSRVRVIFHGENMGVGGALISGYQQALKDGATVMVKVDGDGQMDPSFIPRFVNPIVNGVADYTKGNRFFDIRFLVTMPRLRLFGNSILSLVSKVASGYWDIMDPTNGYTAIHANVLRCLPLDKIDKRYFFESDMLFRLNTVRAVVQDVPLEARYNDEVSNLNIRRVACEFPGKYIKRFCKRLFYNYFLRDFNAGTVQFFFGVLLLFEGCGYGAWKWYSASSVGIPATSGVVMLSALPILLGFQLLVSAINYDISNVPRECLHKKLEKNHLAPDALAKSDNSITL